MLMAGNWKMNLALEDAAALARGVAAGVGAAGDDGVDVAVCPAFPFLASVREALGGSGVALGAQDVSAHDAGAYTGEVSAAMLASLGCRYVLVGHSERRQYHGETDALVADKAAVALEGGLTPIVCVGETLEERDADQTDAVVARQAAAVLDRLGDDAATVVVAYEPVWAIGTGRTATPEQAQAVHAALRQQLAEALGAEAAASVPILYGGSMNPANAADLLARPDIDGGLVGGASLKPDSFLALVEAARTAHAARGGRAGQGV